jgi:hypothetical protein
MALSHFSDCKFACPECPITGLGDGAVEAVNDVTDEFDPVVGGHEANPQHDDYEDNMLGAVLVAAEAHGVSIEHAPAIMAAAQRVLTAECPQAAQLTAA